METNVHYTIVGAFVIILFSAIILGIVWLSSGFSVVQYSIYMLNMQESVSGLSIDAPVEYNGVNVGVVKSIEIDHENTHVVKVLLSIKTGTPITKGTTATLTTRGITGISFIALKDNNSSNELLVAEKGQPYPVIPTTPSLFTRIDNVLRNLGTNFQRVADAIQGLLDKDNQASIKATLANLRTITNTLADNSQRMEDILANTAKATQHLGPLLQSSSGTMMMLQNQTLPAAYRLLNNLNDVAQSLSEVSNVIKANPAVLIRGAQPLPLGPGEKR